MIKKSEIYLSLVKFGQRSGPARSLGGPFLSRLHVWPLSLHPNHPGPGRHEVFVAHFLLVFFSDTSRYVRIIRCPKSKILTLSRDRFAPPSAASLWPQTPNICWVGLSPFSSLFTLQSSLCVRRFPEHWRGQGGSRMGLLRDRKSSPSPSSTSPCAQLRAAYYSCFNKY